MVPVHYGILGTTTVHHDDGNPVQLGGARLRALLAALVLRQGRPVPAELLVDEVWGADPPQDSAAALQTLVGRLRRTVGRAEVGSGPAGYWLTGPSSDLGDFQRLADHGRRALAEGDHTRAAEDLHAALALWRGPALADLPDRSGPAARLEAQHDEARRHRITADLALGRAARVAAELAELCGQRPLDEQLQALLIRALHEDGRTAEALQQYEGTRRALADRLGADPGPVLRALHRQLLAPAPLPAPATVPTPAPPPAEAPERAGAPQDGPAGRRQRPGGNLRPRLTSFVGRDGDLAALGRALAAGRLTTLTGPGGSGKTRLSVEAGRAAQAEGGWPDGVWVAELAPLEDPAAVPGAVVSALGLRETVVHTAGAVTEVIEGREADPVRRIVDHCGRRRMLLVLDNCEHVIQAAADLADRLLAECPGLTVLATSREPLGVPGEQVLPVEPLPADAALRLLAERGAAARPGFDPAEDERACAEICRRLDGLPLAIELAAARLRGLTPRQIADRLDGRFALLTAGSRTLLPRQQTLRAVVDWSWDLLGKRERAVLRRLAVFAGGCTLESAEQVLADGAEVPAEEVADLLLSLVDKSLLVAGLGERPRYWLLETIHEYAVERLAESGEGAAVAARHTACYRELVRTADLRLHGPEQLHWLAVLEREQDNVRAALRRAVDAGDEPQALVIALGMSWFWSMRDFHKEANAWYELICELGPDPFAPDAPPPVPLELDPVAAGLPLGPGHLAEARRQAHLYRLVTRFSGNLAEFGDPEVVALAERIFEVYTPDLPQSFRFPALLRVFAAFVTGEMDGVRRQLDDAVAGVREHGRPADLAMVLQIRARLLNDWVGGLDQAVRDSEESLAISLEQQDAWAMSEAYSSKAENLAKRGDSAGSAEAYRRAIELVLEIGAPQEVPLLQARLGEAVYELDQVEGERLIREALRGIDAGDEPRDGAVLYGRLLLCNILVQRGEYQEAIDQLDRLGEQVRDQASFGPLVPDAFESIVSCVRGWVTARAGDAAAGLALLTEGRRGFTGLAGPGTVFVEHMTVMLLLPAAGILHAYARQFGDLGVAHRGAVMLGAHLTLHGSQGSYTERLERARDGEGLAELLGAEAYRRALEEGGRLSLSEATALLNDPVAG
ncbi:BTAD domain-containing putative transcriptional regulator [Kitasatospora sp. NPDC094015]|uniref:AfsR/SARP family transcriptional regulator n=1 Tax=Kitasatospora sp. NPDC094015 TaxID=3155205 RepID=UPI00331D1D48